MMPMNGPPMVVLFPLSLSSPQGGIYGESGYTGGMFGYGNKDISMNHEYHHQYQRNYQGDEYGSNFPYHTTKSHSNEELLHRHHCVSTSDVMEFSRSSSLPPLPVPAVAKPIQLPRVPSTGFGQRQINDPSPSFKTTMDDEDSVVSLPDHLDSIFD